MPEMVMDLVGQGDGVRLWGGRWPPCWDSSVSSQTLAVEGTRGLCASRAEQPPKQRPLPVLPHTPGLGPRASGKAWPPGDGPRLRAPGSTPDNVFLRLDYMCTVPGALLPLERGKEVNRTLCSLWGSQGGADPSWWPPNPKARPAPC